MYDVLLDTPSPKPLRTSKLADSAVAAENVDDVLNRSSGSTVVLNATSFLSKSIDSALDLNQSLNSGTNSRLGSFK
jgi:hypothetical protein